MTARTIFDLTFSRAGSDARRRAADVPMRMLVMGGFGGNRRGAQGADTRRVRRVDMDNIDAVMAALAPSLVLPSQGGGPPLGILFSELDDFHPDALFRRLAPFQGLRELRRRLSDPATFEAAVAELRTELGSAPNPVEAEVGRPSEPARAESDTDTLERLLGAGGKPAAPTRSESAVDALIRQMVAPHIRVQTPRLEVYLEAVDRAAEGRMRAILHHPDFQRLESAWRGLHWLLSSVEMDGSIEVGLLDMDKEELRADLLAADTDPRRSQLYRLLVDGEAGVPGATGWSLLVGDYAFDAAGDDVLLLSAIGAVGAMSGAPFLARARSAILGCPDLAGRPDPQDWDTADAVSAQNWQVLRRSEQARWIGLALPRILLRLPYGRQTEPCELLAFEEMSSVPEHETYLWGNPAFACALVLARAYREQGWEMSSQPYAELEDLPAYTYKEDGEPRMQACAEVCLTERAGRIVAEHGCIPLFSYKDRNSVRIGRLRSLAVGEAELLEVWTR
jgi:type VI secretion system protein ImpC